MHIVCIPVEDDRGLAAPVARGLESAAVLLLVDTSTLAFRPVSNAPQRRRERGCDPCLALDDASVDAVIVGAIEADALDRMMRRRIAVYVGAWGSASTALSDYLSGRLRAIVPRPAP